jgi:hypothetical protein
MKNIKYVPETVLRVVQVKFCKKIIGFLAARLQANSKRRALAEKLYADLVDFEMELKRCVKTRELAEYSSDIWANLRGRELPCWLIDTLYSVLTFDPTKTPSCPSMLEDKKAEEDGEEEEEEEEVRGVKYKRGNELRAGDIVELEHDNNITIWPDGVKCVVTTPETRAHCLTVVLHEESAKFVGDWDVRRQILHYQDSFAVVEEAN